MRMLLAATLLVVVAACTPTLTGPESLEGTGAPDTRAPDTSAPASAGRTSTDLERLVVKGRAPLTGYERDLFGDGWTDTDHNGCDTRNDILRRDLTNVRIKANTRGCVVLGGNLADPYTGKAIRFVRGGRSEVDIDHLVPLANAWQMGASKWAKAKRVAFANDPRNLLAVASGANRQKRDANAASWLPRRSYWCAYAMGQIEVKRIYGLAVTQPEKAQLARIIDRCPG